MCECLIYVLFEVHPEYNSIAQKKQHHRVNMYRMLFFWYEWVNECDYHRYVVCLKLLPCQSFLFQWPVVFENGRNSLFQSSILEEKEIERKTMDPD